MRSFVRCRFVNVLCDYPVFTGVYSLKRFLKPLRIAKKIAKIHIGRLKIAISGKEHL